MPVWMNWIDNPSPVAVTIISVALMLAIGFIFFILPVITEQIIICITALRCGLTDFIRS